jgi:hypothetical protein
MAYYQQIRIKKCFLKKPLDGVSVEILYRKNLPDAILIFGRHFGFCSNPLPFIFSKNMSIFFIKNNFIECKKIHSMIFAKFMKIKSQKSAILDCAAILKDLKKRSSTKR